MKRVAILLLCFVLILFLFPACSVPEGYEPQEQPHLYWKDIDVVITDIQQDHWYTPPVHNYKITITVHSEEYDLTETLSATGRGMFGAPKHWDARKGDIIKVRLHSYVIDSTGEIVRRKIHSFA